MRFHGVSLSVIETTDIIVHVVGNLVRHVCVDRNRTQMAVRKMKAAGRERLKDAL